MNFADQTEAERRLVMVPSCRPRYSAMTNSAGAVATPGVYVRSWQKGRPERAVLELLSDVGVRQPLQEARDLLEGTPSLRAAVLQELLERCKQVKAVRFCLTLGRELNLPWAAKLDPKRLPTGSEQRWVGRSKEGLLVLNA